MIASHASPDHTPQEPPKTHATRARSAPPAASATATTKFRLARRELSRRRVPTCAPAAAKTTSTRRRVRLMLASRALLDPTPLVRLRPRGLRARRVQLAASVMARTCRLFVHRARFRRWAHGRARIAALTTSTLGQVKQTAASHALLAPTQRVLQPTRMTVARRALRCGAHLVLGSSECISLGRCR